MERMVDHLGSTINTPQLFEDDDSPESLDVGSLLSDSHGRGSETESCFSGFDSDDEILLQKCQKKKQICKVLLTHSGHFPTTKVQTNNDHLTYNFPENELKKGGMTVYTNVPPQYGNVPKKNLSPQNRNAPMEDLSPQNRNASLEDISPQNRNAPMEDLSPQNRNAPTEDLLPQNRNAPMEDLSPQNINAPMEDLSLQNMNALMETLSPTPIITDPDEPAPSYCASEQIREVPATEDDVMNDSGHFIKDKDNIMDHTNNTCPNTEDINHSLVTQTSNDTKKIYTVYNSVNMMEEIGAIKENKTDDTECEDVCTMNLPTSNNSTNCSLGVKETKEKHSDSINDMNKKYLTEESVSNRKAREPCHNSPEKLIDIVKTLSNVSSSQTGNELPFLENLVNQIWHELTVQTQATENAGDTSNINSILSDSPDNKIILSAQNLHQEVCEIMTQESNEIIGNSGNSNTVTSDTQRPHMTSSPKDINQECYKKPNLGLESEEDAGDIVSSVSDMYDLQGRMSVSPSNGLKGEYEELTSTQNSMAGTGDAVTTNSDPPYPQGKMEITLTDRYYIENCETMSSVPKCVDSVDSINPSCNLSHSQSTNVISSPRKLDPGSSEALISSNKFVKETCHGISSRYNLSKSQYCEVESATIPNQEFYEEVNFKQNFTRTYSKANSKTLGKKFKSSSQKLDKDTDNKAARKEKYKEVSSADVTTFHKITKETRKVRARKEREHTRKEVMLETPKFNPTQDKINTKSSVSKENSMTVVNDFSYKSIKMSCCYKDEEECQPNVKEFTNLGQKKKKSRSGQRKLLFKSLKEGRDEASLAKINTFPNPPDIVVTHLHVHQNSLQAKVLGRASVEKLFLCEEGKGEDPEEPFRYVAYNVQNPEQPVRFVVDNREDPGQVFNFGSDNGEDPAQPFGFGSDIGEDPVQPFGFGSDIEEDPVQPFGSGSDNGEDQQELFSFGLDSGQPFRSRADYIRIISSEKMVEKFLDPSKKIHCDSSKTEEKISFAPQKVLKRLSEENDFLGFEDGVQDYEVNENFFPSIILNKKSCIGSANEEKKYLCLQNIEEDNCENTTTIDPEYKCMESLVEGPSCNKSNIPLLIPSAELVPSVDNSTLPVSSDLEACGDLQTLNDVSFAPPRKSKGIVRRRAKRLLDQNTSKLLLTSGVKKRVSHTQQPSENFPIGQVQENTSLYKKYPDKAVTRQSVQVNQSRKLDSAFANGCQPRASNTAKQYKEDIVIIKIEVWEALGDDGSPRPGMKDSWTQSFQNQLQTLKQSNFNFITNLQSSRVIVTGFSFNS
ncbi:hypothetical protein Hamer_G019298 [Homarus americanus]|uniref:Uncharacterized protein n=1 Tax=Homarus americanus TaxID=6706 RepID=A0A8J5MMM7_HOMAM|nr:hypothetical protein Hamer_G019298 [Homarus americanus]